MSKLSYRCHVRPLSAAEGGGYMVEYPDLPGCMADGATPEEAMRNGTAAVKDWLAAAKSWGKAIPKPTGQFGKSTGQWVQRVPVSLHMSLKVRAEAEGVSLNQLVSVLLAQSISLRVGVAGKSKATRTSR